MSFADTIDELDAEVFSGDSLEDPANREILKEHIDRWLRALHKRDDFVVADGWIAVEDGDVFSFPGSDRDMTNDSINSHIALCIDNEIIPPELHLLPFILIEVK